MLLCDVSEQNPHLEEEIFLHIYDAETVLFIL